MLGKYQALEEDVVGKKQNVRLKAQEQRIQHIQNLGSYERQLEEFGQEASKAIRAQLDAGERFVLVTAPDARPYVRMIIERLYSTLPVLSHVEIAKGVEIRVLGSVS